MVDQLSLFPDITSIVVDESTWTASGNNGSVVVTANGIEGITVSMEKSGDKWIATAVSF
jgi:hypothetical protein